MERTQQICSSQFFSLQVIQRGLCHESHAPSNARGEAGNTALEGMLARHRACRMAEELIMIAEDEENHDSRRKVVNMPHMSSPKARMRGKL
jgi:hypothetical protein